MKKERPWDRPRGMSKRDYWGTAVLLGVFVTLLLFMIWWKLLLTK